jgi:daunorubicin resistance ABC transporter ATP-binding subunit
MADSAVHVEGVVKRFGATKALAGVDLDVEEATVFGLLGPNGAGKTTLVRVLATLLAPDAGRAAVFGRDVVDDAAGVRELLGLTGQFAAVDEMLTGRENLQMFGRLFDLSAADARRRANELLERFDLADAADRPARTYSGGMRRRLDLASSLLTRPRVLFLDEPTTGLDPRSRNEIWSVVRELVAEGTTLLLTTQYLEEADQLADQIAVIDHGRVIAQGTGNELKDRVGGQILEVELMSAAQRDNARAALAGIGCGEPEPGERLSQLTLPAPRDGLEMIEDAASALRRAEIAVSDLGLRRPTLDDVFLQLTGAPPSENGAGPEAASGDGRPSPTSISVPAAHAPAVRRPAPRRPPRWRRVCGSRAASSGARSIRCGSAAQSLLTGVHAFATPVVGWLAATQARLGMPDEARATLSGFSAAPDGMGAIGNARSAICMAEGDSAAALDALREVRADTPQTGPAFTLAEAHLRAGIAHLSLGDRDAAVAAAEEALAAAEPDRLIFPFAMTEAAELLDALPRHETAHGALLADIVDVLRGASVSRTDQERLSPPEELSPSELRVLRFLPTNMTRPEIAGELYVSINTVNTHIRNIYAKLGARSRSSAVQRARELRLLSTGGSRAPSK